MMNDGDIARQYRTHGNVGIVFVGGPLDGKKGVDPARTTFFAHVDDNGKRIDEELFARSPRPFGYVHWCGHDSSGNDLHAYVHGSFLGMWLERWDRARE